MHDHARVACLADSVRYANRYGSLRENKNGINKSLNMNLLKGKMK